MCEPISLAVMAGTSAAISGYSAIAQGNNAKATADYNAKVQENAALDAQQRGSIAAAEHQDKVRRMISTQNVTAAANGVMTNTGTPLDIMVDTAGMGTLDALRIRNNADNQAMGLYEQAKLTRIEGNNAKTAGTLNAVGSLLSGASSAAKGYYGMKSFVPSTYNASKPDGEFT